MNQYKLGVMFTDENGSVTINIGDSLETVRENIEKLKNFKSVIINIDKSGVSSISIPLEYFKMRKDIKIIVEAQDYIWGLRAPLQRPIFVTSRLGEQYGESQNDPVFRKNYEKDVMSRAKKNGEYYIVK